MGYLPIILALVLMFMGIPVAISLLAACLLYFGVMTDGYTLTTLVHSLITNSMGATSLAPPFFIMVGTVMNYAGITDRLLNFCDLLLGHKEGGLAYVNVLLSTINGGICGSATADASLQCKILVPQMEKHGYPRSFSAVVTAASGLITPIIPPGVSLILYAVICNISAGQMFAAGYVPGIMLCIAMMIVVAIYSKKHHWKGDRTERAPLKDILKAGLESIWSILIPILIIVGIRGGYFTAVEGGAFIILVCLLVGIFAYKTIKWKHVKPMLSEAFHSTASIMLLIVISVVFSTYLSWERIPQNLAAAMLTISSSKLVFWVMVNLLLLFLGMFLDGTALLMIMTPLLYPIAQAYGINLVHFGIVIIINIAMGSLTPPFGGVMYVVCSLTKVSIVDFMKYAWSFLLCMAIVLVLLIIFPQIVLFIPNTLLG